MVQRRLSFAVRLGSLLFCLCAGVWAQTAGLKPLTTLAEVHAISNETAARNLPVRFEATVTYFEPGNVDLFVQDGDAAIYVETPAGTNLRAGDRVRVEGITRASFRPEIEAHQITFLRHGELPAAIEGKFDQLIRAELDCRRVTVHAVVRAANAFTDGPGRSLLLDLSMEGGPIQAQVAEGGTAANVLPLLDSTVEITGAVAGHFDSKMQMTGVLLEVQSLEDLRIVKPASLSPRQLAPRKFDEILQGIRVEDHTERVRVEGTITYYQPGAALVLQDGTRALWVDTRSEEPHAVGDHALVSGFPGVRNGSVVLTGAEIESTRSQTPLQVPVVNAAGLASGVHAFELVSAEGQLLMRVRERAQDQYVIASEGRVFSAIYRHPERGLNLPLSPMLEVPLGSRVRVTGICVLDHGDQFRGQVAFHLLLRSSQDLAVLAGPSLISVRNLAILLGLAVAVMFVVIGKALLLERKLRRQDVAKGAAIERWRTRVIDGINAAIPLRETLLQITELVSFKVQAEYCWAEIEFEGTFGNCPGAEERARLEIVEDEIPARSGGALGRICVGFERHRLKPRVGPEAFENAVRLAALAIETGGRYSELVRRSEVDALTGAQNRFAFDRALDAAIEREREAGGRFGLIYIDLDEFKLVNDQFGHHIGDRYLQETVARLREQLRANDLLARIGGDEFAVLVMNLNSREEVQEIAHRLQSAFGTPFRFDRTEIPASASMGAAVFPEDAASRAALMEYADTRMYMAKRQKKRESKIHVVGEGHGQKTGRWGT
ncbi:diguanylate cyclase [Acidobacteria bacterium AB60]|nr:diguanylate cyclase [Acidobacteria bacterium AB60]